MKKICILIPSLEPDSQLIQYVRELNTIENVNIVVVNDGSSKEYEKIFLRNIAVVLHACRLRGKDGELEDRRRRRLYEYQPSG